MITPRRLFWPRALTAAVFAVLAARTIALADTQAWLLLSHDLRETLVSTDPKEKAHVMEGGWKLNGAARLADEKQPGALPLHRMSRASKDGNDRYLEFDGKKVAALVKDGFIDEGVMGYVSPKEQPGLIPVYRFKNGDNNLWLVDLKDQPAVEKSGWKLDGPAFWAWPANAKAAPAAQTKAMK